jgi:hypothetical protein
MQYLIYGLTDNETPDHIDALLVFRERARSNPDRYRDYKLSDPEFMEALELVTKSSHPYAVAINWDLSPFMPFNGDPTALWEQWNISRRQAADTLWKIEHDEPIETWECTFIRFEYAVQREAASKTETEISNLKEAHKTFIGFSLLLLVIYLISLLLPSPLGSNVQFGASFLYLFPVAGYAGEMWKLYKSKNRRASILEDLHEIRSLSAKAKCREVNNCSLKN